MGGATRHIDHCRAGSRFQSTLPVGGATGSDTLAEIAQGISIHAPRGGSDDARAVASARVTYFNPRSPWGERPERWQSCFVPIQFQSTLPVGGATGSRQKRPAVRPISIHAPRGGSDPAILRVPPAFPDFNPRSPWGERPEGISPWPGLVYFNPRSPWGERPSWATLCLMQMVFQSTLPVGGATSLCVKFRRSWVISIHAPRGGSDTVNPDPDSFVAISIHAPRGGSDPGTEQ